MNKQISFSNVNFEFVKDYDSDEFALGKMAILSTAQNSHKIPFTDEDLLKYGETAKGKWVVCYFNGTAGPLERKVPRPMSQPP